MNVYILLELCPCQTMLELVKRRGCLSELEAQFYTRQLLLTVQHLQAERVIHRDLKLGNLFLDAALQLKVGDFGLATRLEHAEERKRTICGTPNYIAPEILDNSAGHSFEVDVWAVGVILFTLLYGAPPFETAAVKTTYCRIRDNDYSFPSPSDSNYRPVTPAAKSLIRRILCTDPLQRPSVACMLSDEFFTQSPVPPCLSPAVLDAEHPAQHACMLSIKEEERRDREDEDERRRSRAKQADTEAEAQQQQPRPQAAEAENAAAVSAAPPAAASRAVLSERSVNIAEQAEQQQLPPSAPSALVKARAAAAAGADGEERKPKAAAVRAAVAAAAVPASLTPPAGRTTLAARREQLEREREEIIARLKARAAPALPSPAPCPPSLPSPPPPAAASAAPAVCHPFLHSAAPLTAAAAGGRAASSSSPPAAASSRSPHSSPCPPARRTLTGVPSALLTLSPSLRRSLSAAQAALLLSSSASSSSASPPSACRPASCPPPPPPPAACAAPAASAACGPLAWSSSSPQLVSIPSAEAAGLPLVALPCDTAVSAGGCGADTEAEEARRAGEQRRIRAEVELKIEDERRRLRAQQQTQRLPACKGQQAAGAGAAAADTLLPPLPSVIEESFLSSGCASLPGLYVERWVDYSSKYGLGYLLSDGRVGVYFNDASKAVTCSPGSHRFLYMERRTREQGGGEAVHELLLQPAEPEPQHMHKKLTLLRHFHKYLTQRRPDREEGEAAAGSGSPPSSSSSSPSSVYVRKWLRTKHAIFFRLSDGGVQAVFNDRTELVLDSARLQLHYTDRRSVRQSVSLQQPADCQQLQPDIAKRLRYTNEVIARSPGSSREQQSQQQPDSQQPKPKLRSNRAGAAAARERR